MTCFTSMSKSISRCRDRHLCLFQEAHYVVLQQVKIMATEDLWYWLPDKISAFYETFVLLLFSPFVYSSLPLLIVFPPMLTILPLAYSSLPELLEKKRLIDMHMNLATALLDHIKVRQRSLLCLVRTS